jgi:hypothetical protein
MNLCFVGVAGQGCLQNIDSGEFAGKFFGIRILLGSGFWAFSSQLSVSSCQFKKAEGCAVGSPSL